MHLIYLISIFLTFSINSLAHENDGDVNETIEPDVSMVSLPIHIGLDGEISYGIGLMDHSSHTGTHTGHMNHDDMSGDMNHDGMSGDMNHDGMSGDMNHDGMSGDMNHDGMGDDMNNDGMDHGDTSNNDEANQSNHVSHGDGWMWHLMPMLHIGGDYYKRVISLSSSDTIEVNDTRDGFVLIENKTIQAGGGLMLMAMPPISWGGFLHAGIMPYKGGHVFRMKKTSNPKTESIRSMVTPYSLRDLNNWSIADKLSYSTQGGVMFSAGLGITILTDFSYSYMAQGTWITTIAKVGKTKALVSIKNKSMKMFMSNIGTTIAYLQKHKFNNADKSFNFIFDLSKSEGLQAYKDMIRGNIVTAQNLIRSEIGGVRPVSYTQTNSFGRMRSFSYGVPFLYKDTSMVGNTISQSVTENFLNNSKMNMEMSMFMRSRKSSGVSSNHRDTGFVFMGHHHELIQNNKKSDSIGGSFKWYFQNENSSPWYIKSRLNRAISILGLEKIDGLQLDGLPKKLNFVRGEIDIPLTKKQILKVIDLAEDKNLYNNMYSRAYIAMNDYFRIPGNYKKICPLKRHRFTGCKKKIYNNTWSKLSKIPRLLPKLMSAYKAKDRTNFSKHLTKLGEYMLANRFVFKEVFRQIGETPKAKLKLMGSKISRTTIDL
jgi:hypothetical protein